MSTKAQYVFNNAMALMDEMSTTKDSNGRYIPNESDIEEYKSRALSIINMIDGSLYIYSDNYKQGEDGVRPICDIVNSYDDDMPLDDHISRDVIPYGLAAHLLLEEDPATANYFNQKYEEKVGGLQRGLTAVSESMRDVYSGGYNDDGDWVNGDGLGFGGGGMWI